MLMLQIQIPIKELLFGGFNPSENILVSWDNYSQYMEKIMFQTNNQYIYICVYIITIDIENGHRNSGFTHQNVPNHQSESHQSIEKSQPQTQLSHTSLKLRDVARSSAGVCRRSVA